MMNYLSLEVIAAADTFPLYFVLVYVVGFIAAVAIGSIAWYNSKRPPGWENTEKPDYVPDLESKQNRK